MPRSNRRPWSSFYWADWLADPAVRLLGNERRGRYIDFLALTHQSETPGQHTEAEVRDMLGYTPDEWPEHRSVFVRCFSVSGEKWVQKRTVEEAERSEREFSRLSEQGRRGGLATQDKARTYQARLEARLKQDPSLSPALAGSQSQSDSQKDGNPLLRVNQAKEMDQAPERGGAAALAPEAPAASRRSVPQPANQVTKAQIQAILSKRQWEQS